MLQRAAPEPQYDDAQWVGEADKAQGYALSGKIMLCAIVILLFVIVIMAGLHLYARWYLLRARRRHLHRRRRTHVVVFVDPNNPSTATTRGLDSVVLKSIPVFTYSPESETHPEKEEALECAVCLSEFEENEKGRRLPKCNHSFHIECIDMWFHSHSTCPLCRTPVVLDLDLDLPVRVTQNPPPELPPQVVDTLGDPGSVPSEPGSSSGFVNRGEARTTSLGARRKAVDLVGVSIEVPRRSATFGRSEEHGSPSSSPSPAFKSPGAGRIRSLRRILSRDIRAALSPASAPSCSSVSREVDLERAQTPRRVSECRARHESCDER